MWRNITGHGSVEKCDILLLTSGQCRAENCDVLWWQLETTAWRNVTYCDNRRTHTSTPNLSDQSQRSDAVFLLPTFSSYALLVSEPTQTPHSHVGPMHCPRHYIVWTIVAFAPTYGSLRHRLSSFPDGGAGKGGDQ